MQTSEDNSNKKAHHVTPEQSSSADGGDDSTGEWIKDPTENDVLCGRGGSINSHPGNERFRNLVERRKRVYLTARFKREKRLIASSIVSEIRNLDPPGRFLSRDAGTSGRWRDIGDEKARDKTSQALRENAPSIRAEIETEIKEQRAEMQRAEEEEYARSGGGRYHHHESTGYYGNGWGYYYGYGGGGQHPPPPPPPPPPPSYYDGGHWGQWQQPHYGSGGSDHQHHHYPSPPQPSPHPPATTKSTLDYTADMVASGAESIMSGAESIKSYFVGGTSSYANHHAMKQSSSSNDEAAAGGGRGHHGGSSSAEHSNNNNKPIMYVHDSKRRRIVKFRDDTRQGGGGGHLAEDDNRMLRRRRGTAATSGRGAAAAAAAAAAAPTASHYGSSSGVNSTGSNSLVTEDHDVDDAAALDIEPEDIDAVGEQNSSLMAQMANQILSSIGSWDASTIVCGQDTADERAPPTFPRGPPPGPPSSDNRYHNHNGEVHEEEMEHIPEEDLTVEWEGQEVLLMTENDDCSERGSSQERMPPPVARRTAPADAVSSVGFSSLGSCSWLPDTASIFSSTSNNNNNNNKSVLGGGGISPVASMDMEYAATGGGGSVGGGGYSVGGSVGGGSLTRVFESDAVPDAAPVSMGSPSMSHRVLQQVPSWERSLRSKSPLSLGSDDGSMMSKCSSKVPESGLVASQDTQPPPPQPYESAPDAHSGNSNSYAAGASTSRAFNDMLWETTGGRE